MSRSIDQDEQHKDEWEKNRLKQYSQNELDKIAAEDAEREEAQSYINEQAAKCVEEHPDLVSSEGRIKKLAEQKKKREEERWRRFHYMGKS